MTARAARLGCGIRYVCILMSHDCKPGDPPPKGYLAWHEWAGVQHKAGLRQKRCGTCSLFKYPQELSAKIMTSKAFRIRRDGTREDVEVSDPLCLDCAAKGAGA